MSSRERVAGALARRATDRIPMGTVAGLYGETVPGLEAHLGVCGAESVSAALGLDDRWASIRAEREDPPGSGCWRTAWGTFRKSDGGATPYTTASGRRPLRDARTVSDVDAYPWPHPDDFVLDEATAARAQELQSYSFLLAGVPPTFCTLSELMGMDVALMNMVLAPVAVEAAVARIAEIGLAVTKQVLKQYGPLLHQVYLWDDVADSRSMLFRPELWRRWIRPHLADQVAAIKRHGLIAHYHCCGAMAEIIPDLIDMGVDILQPCQVHLPGMEPAWLKREFGARVTFWGGVNTQQTLPFGTPEQVRKEVRERMRTLGRGGGYVLSPDHSLMPDVPPENIAALYDEGTKCLGLM
jgi:uroporphyrinogen decarboxylase